MDGSDGALQHAYDRLTECGCTNGCYLCLRSYSTHYHAADVDKGVAIMAIGYLLGRNPFIPDLAPLAPAPDHRVDLAFEIGLSGRQVSVQALDWEFTEEVGTSQNAALFRAMSRAIGAEHQASDLALRVVVGPSVEYLADFINGQRLGNKARPEEKYAFERLLFEMLRFSSVDAVTYNDL